jgi:hypothetical protein
MVSAALVDPAVVLNRKWAEEMFPSSSVEHLVILHEDELELWETNFFAPVIVVRTPS